MQCPVLTTVVRIRHCLLSYAHATQCSVLTGLCSYRWQDVSIKDLPKRLSTFEVPPYARPTRCPVLTAYGAMDLFFYALCGTAPT
eukprot:2073069-Rhodomonas_salina.3